ncbi:hypothetical protein K0M31_013830 [Melipona bicolor]|uniref:Uncharacterized protein n=1 Tax=Melipona bicolor TaxID=60889 RepID=A0AA40G7C4_9HYME|nr:hypothetical protein K0M31_013830 [Melipona bicolor]
MSLTNVPDVSRLVQRIKIGGQVRGVDGHRSSGQQAIPVRVPPELLAGRGESGSSGAGAALRSPGLAVYRRSATKAGGLVRKGQADEQRHGQARPEIYKRPNIDTKRVSTRRPASARDHEGNRCSTFGGIRTSQSGQSGANWSSDRLQWGVPLSNGAEKTDRGTPGSQTPIIVRA